MEEPIADYSTVLIVEDEQLVALDMESSLEKLGYVVAGIAITGEQALEIAEERRPDLVLMDIRLPGEVDGIAAAALIRDRWDIPVIFVTAFSGEEVIVRAKAAGPYGFLTKPFRTEELNPTIRVALYRHQFTRKLFSEHTWFTTMLESLSDAVIATDAEGFVRYLNPAAEALIGWPQQEAEGKPIEEVYPLSFLDGSPVQHCQLRKALESRAPVARQRFCVTTMDGSTISVEDSATPILEKDRLLGAVTIFQDISHQQKAEHALRESEKLAVVGRLASSISHEINNPLEAITNLLYLAEHQLAPESPVLSYIQQASAELARITHITTETLRFHRQSTRPTEVQITRILESVLALHEGRARTLQVSVERRYRECCPLLVFENEIRQVLANLVGNALDAMITSRERRLMLQVRNATGWRKGRPGLRVTIADTGGGIPPEARKSLFKPFFTTKAVTGTGLGLWVSSEIVDKHNGSIQFRSSIDERRHGTVFSVFVPAESQ